MRKEDNWGPRGNLSSDRQQRECGSTKPLGNMRGCEKWNPHEKRGFGGGYGADAVKLGEKIASEPLPRHGAQPASRPCPPVVQPSSLPLSSPPVPLPSILWVCHLASNIHPISLIGLVLPLGSRVEEEERRIILFMRLA